LEAYVTVVRSRCQLAQGCLRCKQRHCLPTASLHCVSVTHVTCRQSVCCEASRCLSHRAAILRRR